MPASIKCNCKKTAYIVSNKVHSLCIQWLRKQDTIWLTMKNSNYYKNILQSHNSNVNAFTYLRDST